MTLKPLFPSFFIGGLECSSHRLGRGTRLDVLASSRHCEFYPQDYARLRAHGISTLRSGLAWDQIEARPGEYRFAPMLGRVRAAREMGMHVVWDLCHYGWPDDLDIFSAAFIDRFAAYAGAAARMLAAETDGPIFVCPINEISFFAWGGGDVGYLNPFWRGRGHELKVHLVRAAIAAVEAVWASAPGARIVHVDPVINVIAHPDRPHDHPWAEGHRQAQYQAWDMLSGQAWPQLGGSPRHLDIVGVNYYSNNQWIHGSGTVWRDDPLYRPFRQILTEVHERYHRPLFVAETGAEGDARAGWAGYVAGEVEAALHAGTPVEGLCLYPILNHPGWDDDRHCHNGMWDYADDTGHRPLYQPLADVVTAFTPRLTAARAALLAEDARRIRQGARALALEGALRVGETAPQPRVMLFTDSLEASGMGEHMATLAEALRDRCAITFAMPGTEANLPYLRRATRAGVAVEQMRVRGEDRASFEHLRDRLRDGRFDVFHAHAGIAYEGHDAVYAALFSDVPARLRTEHLPYTLNTPFDRAHYARLLGVIDHVIAVSHASRESFVANGVPERQITTVHNGAAPRIGTRGPQLRTALKLPPGAPLIVTIGRFTDQKGYRDLLAALPTLLAALPTAHFAWVGEGPLWAEMRAAVRAAGWAGRVHLVGQRRDVPDWLHAADLFVLPSLFEGLPIVLLEAMTQCTPVVATAVGGVPELITDGVHGRLVAPGQPDMLAQAVIEAVRTPALRKAWAAAAAERVQAAFTPQAMAEKTLALYRAVLDAHIAPAWPLVRADAAPARSAALATASAAPVFRAPRPASTARVQHIATEKDPEWNR